VDHYCAAHALGYRTEVERLVPPDLLWGGTSLLRSATAVYEYRFPPNTVLVEGQDSTTTLLFDTAKPVPEWITLDASLPPTALARDLELRLKASRTRSVAVQVGLDGTPFTLTLLRPDGTVLEKGSVEMFHRIPRSWLRSTALRFSFHLVSAPGFFRNSRMTAFSLDLQDMTRSCPQLEELSIRAR
jgi:hypothetical protein